MRLDVDIQMGGGDGGRVDAALRNHELFGGIFLLTEELLASLNTYASKILKKIKNLSVPKNLKTKNYLLRVLFFSKTPKKCTFESQKIFRYLLKNGL